MKSTLFFGLLAVGVAIAFYGVPVVKLAPTLGARVIPLVVVVLIGIGMMLYEFYENVRDSREDGED